MSIKVLYIWKSEYPWDVRVEKFCNSLIKNGFNVRLLCRWNNEQNEKDSLNFEIIRAGYQKKRLLYEPFHFNPFWIKEIKKSIKEFKPNLIIVREFFLVETTKKIANKFNIPVIFDMAEYYPEAMRGWKKYTDNIFWNILVHKIKFADFLEKRAIIKADGIITVCNELNDRVTKILNKNDNLEIIHNTPEVNWFKNIKKGLNIPPMIFAYHGHFSQDRNLDILVKAFIIAAEKNDKIKLIIAGSGENFHEVKQIAEKSKYANKIIFTGKYNFKEIEKLYSETDIAILPYKANEFINHTISNKFFDYMACGKPMIVSLAIPMIRLINETKSGIYCNCDDEVELANYILNITDYNLTEMSVNGMSAFNDKYNWNFEEKKLVNFLKKFV